IIDVVREPQTPVGDLGAGMVHHNAFRTPTDEQQERWRLGMTARGGLVTAIIDGLCFHPLYFPWARGILFEIAADPAGVGTDETVDHLGDRLMLPPWLEASRADLERRLPRLTRPGLPVAP